MKRELALYKHRNILRVLQSIAFVIFLITINLTVSSCKTEVDLQAKYYKILPAPPSKGKGQIVSKKFNKAMVDYKAGNYLDAYNKIAQSDFYDDEKKMYVAMCLIEMDRAQEGIDILVWLDENTYVTKVKQHVHWYLAVLNLNKNREVTNTYLTKILSNLKHRHYNEALALKADLEQKA